MTAAARSHWGRPTTLVGLEIGPLTVQPPGFRPPRTASLVSGNRKMTLPSAARLFDAWCFCLLPSICLKFKHLNLALQWTLKCSSFSGFQRYNVPKKAPTYEHCNSTVVFLLALHLAQVIPACSVLAQTWTIHRPSACAETCTRLRARSPTRAWPRPIYR